MSGRNEKGRNGSSPDGDTQSVKMSASQQAHRSQVEERVRAQVTCDDDRVSTVPVVHLAKQRPPTVWFGPVARFITNNNLLGFYGFTWVSQVISAIIASERCFCILQPLRSQTVLRTSTTTITIVFVFIIVVGLYSLVTSRYRMACAYDAAMQRTIWTIVPGEFYLKHKALIEALDSGVYGVGFPLVVIVVVTAATTITAVKLKQAAAWRAGTSSSSGVSSREIALTKMLVYNSVFFIVCVLPIAVFRLAWPWMPEINAGKTQHNLYFTCIWILDMLSYANASFNIVVYFTMGSRFRQIFWTLLGRKRKASKPPLSSDRDIPSELQHTVTSHI